MNLDVNIVPSQGCFVAFNQVMASVVLLTSGLA